MNIVINVILVVLLSIAGLIYISREDSKGAKPKDFIIKLWKEHKDRLVVFLLALVYGIATTIILDNFFSDHSWIQQAKVINLTMLMFPIAYVDFKTHKIPNVIVASGLVMRLVWFVIEFIHDPRGFLSILKNIGFGLLIVLGFILMGVFIIKGGLGLGDVKLLILMALFQGFTGLVCTMFVSLFVAFVYSIGLLIVKKKSKKDVIPFGPCILFGSCFCAILLGV